MDFSSQYTSVMRLKESFHSLTEARVVRQSTLKIKEAKQ